MSLYIVERDSGYPNLNKNIYLSTAQTKFHYFNKEKEKDLHYGEFRAS